MRTGGDCRTVGREISRFPRKERLHMPGSLTTPGRPDARTVAPGCVAFRHLHSVGTQNETLYRGRDGHCWPPPTQIRACAANALGSYLEYLTLKRWFGHGCSTRGDGRNRLMSLTIRSHVSRCRWLRRRRLRNQMMLV